MIDQIEIGGRSVGINCPVFIIAEMSGNHNQSYQKALEILHAAKEAGADAVKLQTYTPDTITINCDNEYFKILEGSTWAGQTLYELYRKAYTPWDWHPKLQEEAEQLGITLFSTPFDITSVDFLNKINVPAYKVASFELVDISLIEYIARQGKPIIMSTGMGTLDEIEEAVLAIRKNDNQQIILLKCASDYPARAEDMNLNTIPDMMEKFGLPAGLSDHTLSREVSVAAVALGACVIEKHLTLSRADDGPDAGFSLEPHEFKDMVNAVRLTEKALGKITYKPTESELKNRIFRRSLFVVSNAKAGESVTADNVRSIRPGNGLHTRHFKEIIGQKFTRDVQKGTPFNLDMLKSSGIPDIK